ncbi:MAG: Crp/Fnr family transcriptional regulator [Gillisia sp.]
MFPQLKQKFHDQFEPALIQEMEKVAVFSELPEGEIIIKPGQYIRSIPLLLKGSIKVLRPDGKGEMLFLYHLDEGNTCAATLSCCMGHSKSEIMAVTETPVELLMIPVAKMEEWSSKYKTWRNFIYNSYHQRMMELLESIDNIAFNNMEERLVRYLKARVEAISNNTIDVTHKEIAEDLHSNRVVISRLLKKLEADGKLILNRNFIEVL